MPILPIPTAPFGETADAGLFGGNVLAPRTAMEGPGSYAEAIEALGVTTLRYPGGALTEYYFDITNPDATTAQHALTGEVSDFMPLSDFLRYAGATDREVTIVLPTRDQLALTRTDDNGDRLPDIDEDELRGFIRDVVRGEYGDAHVTGFEIGNEYWGSGGMSAAEYGRLAAEMTLIIDDELARLAVEHPQAAEIRIIVQVGTNFGSSSLDEAYDGLSGEQILADLEATYGLSLDPGIVRDNGNTDWTEVNNEIILARLEEGGALDHVDAVAAHIYSRAPEIEHTRYFFLDQIDDTWLEARPDLEIHVTEWNQRSNTAAFEETSDYGLFQAQEMLEMVEEYLRAGVDEAQVWPLIQNTPSALSFGRDFEELSVPGEMFAMLSANLPGMRMLDFTPFDARDGEFETADMDVHAFADGTDMLLYVTSNSRSGVVQSQLDIAGLVAGVGSVEIVVLGVGAGQAPGDSRSDAVLERLDAGDVYTEGLVDVVLAPGEIMQVRLNDVTPTDDFAPVFEASATDEIIEEDVADDPQPNAGEPPLSADLESGFFEEVMLPAGESSPDDAGDTDDDDDDAGDDLGFGWLIALLPLLAFAGLG